MSGHAAKLPISVMKSRRYMDCPLKTNSPSLPHGPIGLLCSTVNCPSEMSRWVMNCLAARPGARLLCAR
jgi:hypothetical protein